jgi:hypothetical protein
MDLHIISECYIDTKLIKTIAPPTHKKGYNHQKGCTNVIKMMQEKLTNDFAVGVMDKDKRVLDYVKYFDWVAGLENQLELWKHPNKPHYLIFICPAVEKWLLLCADEVNIPLTDFGLPHDFLKLQKITKTAKSEDNDPFSNQLKQLFKSLQKNGARNIIILAYWITYLKSMPYDADLNEIKKITQSLIE